MNVLGVWDGHDAGAVLLVDGHVRAAMNEERFTRRKLEVQFPAQSIAACLAAAGLRAHDVALVSASTSDPAKALGRHTELDARSIAEHAMNVAASICIYTNGNLAIEEL